MVLAKTLPFFAVLRPIWSGGRAAVSSEVVSILKR
jgi:hypothetical protein